MSGMNPGDNPEGDDVSDDVTVNDGCYSRWGVRRDDGPGYRAGSTQF